MKTFLLSLAITVFLFGCQISKESLLPLSDESGITGKTLSNARVAGNGANLAPPPLTTTTFTDASGKVTVKLFKSVRKLEAKMTQRVILPEDYVLAGGGFFLDNWSNDFGGGYILESRPESNLSEWVVSSSYLLNFECYWLTTYAYGIKIEGVPSSTLRQKMKVFTQTSNTSTNPSVSMDLKNTTYYLIGGGGKSNSTMPLVGIMPYGEAWLAEAKGTGSVTSYAIGIDKTMANKWGLSIKQFGKTSQYPLTGLSSESVANSNGYILCGVGGRTLISSTAKRGLVCLYLSSGWIGTVISKDYEKSYSGQNTLIGIGIKKM